MEALNWVYQNIYPWCSIIAALGFLGIYPYIRMVEMVLLLIELKSFKTFVEWTKGSYWDNRVHGYGDSPVIDFFAVICTLSFLMVIAVKILYHPVEGAISVAVILVLVVILRWLIKEKEKINKELEQEKERLNREVNDL